MTVRILVGHALDRLAELPDDSIDLIVTDPPYGDTNIEWDKRIDGWASAARRVLRRSGSLWCFGSMRFFIECAAEFTGWKYAQEVIWEKHNGSGLHNDRFRRVHEIIVQFYRDDVVWGQVYKKPLFTHDAVARTVRHKGRPAHWHGNIGPSTYRSEDGGPRLMRSVMYSRSEHRSGLHPTQKPLACVLPLIEYSCPEGGVILDCFAGSGTTGVAAARLKRAAILIELKPDFAEMARCRIDEDAGLFGHQN